MLIDDVLEDDTIEDISEEELEALPLAVELDDGLRSALAGKLSPRRLPSPPKLS